MNEIEPNKNELERNFSKWTEEEKEQLLEYLHKKYYLLKKTELFSIVLGAITTFAFLVGLMSLAVGGFDESIKTQVRDYLDGSLGSSVRNDLSRLHQQAQNDVESLDQMVSSSQQAVITIDKEGWQNVKMNNLSVRSLSIVDSAGATKIMLGVDIDSEQGPALDFISPSRPKTSYKNGTETISVPDSIHLGTDGEEGSGLFLSDNSGQIKMSAAILPCGCSDLQLFDTSGRTRVEIYFGDNSVSKNPLGWISLLNKEGNTIFQASEIDNSTGQLFLGDKNGNSTFVQPQ